MLPAAPANQFKEWAGLPGLYFAMHRAKLNKDIVPSIEDWLVKKGYGRGGSTISAPTFSPTDGSRRRVTSGVVTS